MDNAQERTLTVRAENSTTTVGSRTVVDLGRGDALAGNPVAYLVGEDYTPATGREVYLDLYQNGDITAEEAYSWAGLDYEIFISIASDPKMDAKRRQEFVISALLLNIEGGRKGNAYTWHFFGDCPMIWSLAEVAHRLRKAGVKKATICDMLEGLPSIARACRKKNHLSPCDVDMAEFIADYYTKHLKQLGVLLGKYRGDSEPDIYGFGNDIMEILSTKM